MPSTVFGLPLHPLVVHATVVFVPLAALAVLLAALWPRFRTWAGYLPLALSGVAVVLVPLTTSTGEDLEHSLPHSQLIEQHAHLGDQLLPVVIGLFVVAVLQQWLWRAPRAAWLGGVALVLALVVAGGTLVQVARIGHSGAKAAWSGVASSDSKSG